MRPQDADHLFASADPAADLDLSASLHSVWGRIHALPDAPPRRRKRALRVALVAGVAAVIAAAMALLPATDRRDGAPGIPAPVQAFADDLSGPGVLHVVTKRTSLVNELGAVTPLPPFRTESWYALDGSAWRTRMSGTTDEFGEQVFDGSTVRAFNSTCGLLAPTSPTPTPVVPRLLELDRDLATGAAQIVGRTIVRGTPAYDVGYDLVPGDVYLFDWHLFVSTLSARLLRIEALNLPYPAGAGPAERTRQRSEVPTYEILPPTRRSARLLLPSPELRRVSGQVCQ
jgi:hypothetical protein